MRRRPCDIQAQVGATLCRSSDADAPPACRSHPVSATEDVKAELERLTSLLAADTSPRTSTIRPPQTELLSDVRLWRWGLDDELLDVAENYLGQPARYYGADVRREVADGRPAHDVRQWHRDIEDHRVFKILVWLNDVGPDGGPFAHVSADGSQDAARQLRYVSGFVSDDAMRAVVPESAWHLCTGPRWTAVMPDTARLFHRATPPVREDRYSVTFTWTSRHPVRTMPAPTVLSEEQIDQIKEGLAPRQLAGLPRAFMV